MWFLPRGVAVFQVTNDQETIRSLIPKLLDIIEHHIRGTLFNIHVDPKDGLLSQGAEGYQLTWMDAKVDGWVGHAAARQGRQRSMRCTTSAADSLEQLLVIQGDVENARRMDDYANRARTSFI